MLESGRWRCEPSVRIGVAHGNNEIAEINPSSKVASDAVVRYRSRDRASSLLFTATETVLSYYFCRQMSCYTFVNYIYVRHSVVKSQGTGERPIDTEGRVEFLPAFAQCVQVYNKSG